MMRWTRDVTGMRVSREGEIMSDAHIEEPTKGSRVLGFNGFRALAPKPWNPRP
jgi:hypothetical protein